jgi:phage terminase large subunit GpA-like protein
MNAKQRTAKDRGYQFACPECGDTETLCVSVHATAKVLQDPEDNNFETEIEGDHEFDRHAWMMCRACEYEDEVRDFDLWGGRGEE